MRLTASYTAVCVIAIVLTPSGVGALLAPTMSQAILSQSVTASAAAIGGVATSARISSHAAVASRLM